MTFNDFLSSFDSIKPLSNFDIIIYCKQFKIKHFKGVFMRDEIVGKTSGNECYILNIDESKNSGTHWTCLSVKNNICYYFDSYGFCPPDEIKAYCDGLECYFSSFKIQKRNEVICGHYCIYLLYLLDNNISFNEAIDLLY